MKQRADGRIAATKRVAGRKVFAYGATPEEAQANLEAKLRDILSTPTLNTKTLHDAAKSIWWPKIEGKREGTVTRYKSAYVIHIRPALGNMDPTEIKPAHIQRFVNDLGRKLISPNGKKNCPKRLMDSRGVRLVYAVLVGIFKTLEDNDVIVKSPCRGINIPEAKPKRERYLEPADAQTVLESVPDDLKLPVFLALVLGLSRGEICALKWDDFNRTKRELAITSQRKHSAEGIKHAQTKRRARVRTLRLTPSFVSYIDAHGNIDHGYLTTYKGKPWRPNELTRQWANFAETKLPEWTFHDLRHGAAGLIAAATGDPRAAQVILGHASLDMTLVYMADASARQDSAMVKLDEFLAAKTGRHEG